MPWKHGDPRGRIIGGKHRAATRYCLMLRRVSAESAKDRTYKDKQVLCSLDEFVEWFMPRDFPGASVDRIDNNGNYELSNMQVIPLADNIRKDKLIARNGQSRCYTCCEWKTLEEFAKDKRRNNGRSTCCKQCDRDRKRVGH